MRRSRLAIYNEDICVGGSDNSGLVAQSGSMMQVMYDSRISLFMVPVDHGNIIDLNLEHKVGDWVKIIW